MTEATKRPWKLVPADRARNWLPTLYPNIVKPDGISFQVFGSSPENEDADAELIVRAVNSRDALVEALESLLSNYRYQTPSGHENCRICDEILDDLGSGAEVHDSNCVIIKARAALALARGEAD